MPFLVKQSLGTDAILSMPRITKGNVAGENVRMSLPFSGKKEKIGTSDTKLSNYNSELASEISDCQRKIDSLDGEISRLQTKYNNEVYAEREAARKAAEELANKGKDLLGI